MHLNHGCISFWAKTHYICAKMENNYLQIVNNMIEYLSMGGSGIGIYGELTPVLNIGSERFDRSS